MTDAEHEKLAFERLPGVRDRLAHAERLAKDFKGRFRTGARLRRVAAATLDAGYAAGTIAPHLFYVPDSRAIWATIEQPLTALVRKIDSQPSFSVDAWQGFAGSDDHHKAMVANNIKVIDHLPKRCRFEFMFHRWYLTAAAEAQRESIVNARSRTAQKRKVDKLRDASRELINNFAFRCWTPAGHVDKAVYHDAITEGNFEAANKIRRRHGLDVLDGAAVPRYGLRAAGVAAAGLGGILLLWAHLAKT